MLGGAWALPSSVLAAGARDCTGPARYGGDCSTELVSRARLRPGCRKHTSGRRPRTRGRAGGSPVPPAATSPGSRPRRRRTAPASESTVTSHSASRPRIGQHRDERADGGGKERRQRRQSWRRQVAGRHPELLAGVRRVRSPGHGAVAGPPRPRGPGRDLGRRTWPPVPVPAAGWCAAPRARRRSRPRPARPVRRRVYSPAAMLNAPAARPASPASTITVGDAAAATPAIKAKFETSPSMAPKTAGRNQPPVTSASRHRADPPS